MSTSEMKVLNVADKETLDEIYKVVKEGSGMQCEPKLSEVEYYERNTIVGPIGSAVDTCTILTNHDNKVGIISYSNSSGLRRVPLDRDNPEKSHYDELWVTPTFALPMIVNSKLCDLIVFGNELHLFGGDNSNEKIHYKLVNNKWEIVSILPHSAIGAKFVVYNGTIHMFGGGLSKIDPSVSTGFKNTHYNLVNGKWYSCSTPSFNLFGMTPVVFDNKIHLIGMRQHHTWANTTDGWITVSTSLPKSLYSPSLIVFNNKIHIGSGYDTDAKKLSTDHYEWSSGTSYLATATLPLGNISGRGFTTKDRKLIYGAHWLHILNESTNTWEVYQELSVDIKGADAVMMNDTIHLLGQGKYHHIWNGDLWTRVDDLPIDFTGGSAIVHNGELHIVANKSHYKFSKVGQWVNVSTLPVSFTNGSLVSYGGTLHIIGGSLNDTDCNHYEFADDVWKMKSVCPVISQGNKSAIVFNNLIYVMGIMDDKYWVVRWDKVAWSLSGIDLDNDCTGKSYIVNRRGALHVFYESGKDLHHYIHVGYGTNYLKCEEIINKTDVAITIHRDVIHVIAGEGSPRTNYSIGNAAKNVKVLSVYLSVGHGIICDRSTIIHLTDNIDVRDTGYYCNKTGICKFGILNPDAPYTFT